MKVIGLSEYGGPEVLRPFELPDPRPGTQEVLVRVLAAGVNPVDAMLRSGQLRQMYQGKTPPFVPGMEVAGTIEEVGSGVNPRWGLVAGAYVVGFVDNLGSRGGYSEYLALSARSVVLAPTGASSAAAAGFLNNALTARNVLDAFRLPPGATLLVTGAAGSVGGYLVELGVAEGLHVVAVAAEDDADLLRSLGAQTLVPRGPGIAERALKELGGPVDAVADAALLHEQIAPAVRDSGQIGILRSWDGDPGRGITVKHLNVRERDRDRDATVRLRDQAEDGTITLRPALPFDADDAGAAHIRLEQGALRERIVLTFDHGN
ncbi:NADP-dependent oxidoreductase [Streptomyces coeruleorubidus]|uniref:NADP-dependent oxidoreductase n=1 Tax=Streptomyces coeruleorubidus TaxID=116188 RepID=A0A5J6I7G1_STRC4|nr:NADP-dependent oxidoreductase [Streptomyces coeruleorubidus]QEV28356.1 NADP-dependent oxidoreductase [Streptomyces coeruleorubidus]GGT60014.1 zinc-binding alcohol dehydrogenase [Streptomyces coeruleorubidus]